MRSINILFLIALLVGALRAGIFSPALAQDSDLIAKAKAEGAVTWYTTQTVDPLVRNLIDAFQKKYGIQVGYYRGGSTDVALKIQQESQAGKLLADIFDGPTPPEALKKYGLVERWLPDITKEFPADFVDPQGYWAATNDTLQSAGINTELIPVAETPSQWSDLLNPDFKGKIIWGSIPSFSGATGFVGLVLKELGDEKGKEFLTELAKQKPAAKEGAARAIMDEVVSGEFAIGLQTFPDHAKASAKLGAPVKWIPMRPAVSSVVSAIAMTKGAPHPNAAKLLLAFILGDEGQTIFRDAFYIPANPHIRAVDPDLDPSRYHAVTITPVELIEKMPAWTAIYNELFK